MIIPRWAFGLFVLSLGFLGCTDPKNSTPGSVPESVDSLDTFIAPSDTIDHWQIALDSVLSWDKTRAATIAGAHQLLEELGEQSIPATSALGMLWHRVGVLHYLEDEYDEAQLAFEEAIRIRRAADGPASAEVGMSSHNLGVVWKEKGNYPAAIPPLETAAQIRNALGDTSRLARSYQELGIVYARSGDYLNALEFHQTALPIFIRENGPQHRSTARSYQSIGIIQRKLGQFEEALVSTQLSLDAFLNLYGPTDANVAASYNNLGTIYDDQGDYQAALSAYQQALAINQELYGAQSLAVAQNYNNLGYTHRQLHQLDRAWDDQQKALAIRIQELGPYHPDIGNTLSNLGDILVARGQLNEALELYQQATIHRFTDFRDSSLLALPDFNQHTLLGSPIDLLALLQERANAWCLRFDQGGNQQDLEAALANYQSCDQLIDQIRQNFKADESTLFLLEQAVPIYEGALQTVYRLWQANHDPALMEQALHFMEKSKAVLLLSSQKEDQARLAANIPDSLLQREYRLRSNLSYRAQRIAERELGYGLTDSLLLELRQQQLAQRQSYDQLVTQFEQDYPRYYQEKFNTEVVSLEALQSFLAERQQSLVEYFVGHQSTYALGISPQGAHLLQLVSPDAIEGPLEQCLSGLNQPNDLVQTQAYALSAHRLFQDLWQPLAEHVGERAVIVPAGPLAYLPFEVLLEEAVDHDRFSDYPYLLKRHQFSYAYSATVLLNNNRETATSPSRSFLGLAPIFSNSSTMAELSHSAAEVQAIQDLIGGTVLLGEEATRAAFTEQAADYRIIHLSSHAAVLDSNRQDAWIAFYPNDSRVSTPDKLYLSQVYALDLPADLVVLSACETARGKLAEGEGVMSLARGFAYAGCQSLVTTLWQVNHASTAQIMTEMYRQLAQGHAKDAALRSAQLSYLEDEQLDNIGRHPYFWSAYRLVGNVAPIQLPSAAQAWLWWVLGGLIFWMGWRLQRGDMGS